MHSAYSTANTGALAKAPKHFLLNNHAARIPERSSPACQQTLADTFQRQAAPNRGAEYHSWPQDSAPGKAALEAFPPLTPQHSPESLEGYMHAPRLHNSTHPSNANYYVGGVNKQQTNTEVQSRLLAAAPLKTGNAREVASSAWASARQADSSRPCSCMTVTSRLPTSETTRAE